MAEGYFEFGTNIAGVSTQVVTELNRILTAVQQTQGRMAQGGAPAQFMQRWVADIGRIGQQAQAQLAQIQAQWETAATRAAQTGQRFQRPGEGTLGQQSQRVAQQTVAQLREQLTRSFRELPEGMRSADMAQIARVGSQGLIAQINAMFRQLQAAMGAVAQQTGVRVGTGLVGGRADLISQRMQDEIARAIPRRDPVQAASAAAEARRGVMDPRQERQVRSGLDRAYQGRATAARAVQEAVELQEAQDRAYAQTISRPYRRRQEAATRVAEAQRALTQQEQQDRAVAQQARRDQQRRMAVQLRGDPTTLAAGPYRQRGGEIFQLQEQRGVEVARRLEIGSQRYLTAQDRLAQMLRQRAVQQQTIMAQERAAAARQFQLFGGGGAARGGGFGGPVGGGGMGGPGDVFEPEGILEHGARYARYALVSAALFGLLGAIRSTKDEAVEYADSLTDLEVAVDGQIQVTQAWKNELMETSRVAGSNVAQAMDSAARGIRAFGSLEPGGEGVEDIGTRTAEMAEQLAIIADKDITDATGDIIAIGTSFGLTAENIDRVNEAIAQAKRLGGYPAEVAQGLSASSLAFREAGFNLEESAALTSLVIARLDQTGQTTGTRLARVFQTARGGPGQAALMGVGVSPSLNVADQLKQLAELRAAGEITDKQFEQVTARVAGTFASREFSVLIRDMATALGSVEEGLLEGGAASREFERRINNLAGLLRRITGSLRGIQVGLIESGALAPFGVLLELLESALRLVNNLLQAFNRLPDAMTTGLVMLGQYALIMRNLSRMDARRIVMAGTAGAPLRGETMMARLLGPQAALRRRERALERIPLAQRPPGPVAEAARVPVGFAGAAQARAQETAAINRGIAARVRATAERIRNTTATSLNTAAKTREAMVVQGRAAAAAAGGGRFQAGMVRLSAERDLLARTGAAQRVGGAVRGAAASPIGQMAIFAGLVYAGTELWDSFKRQREASDQAGEALRGLANVGEAVPDAMREAAQRIIEAAAEMEMAEEGLWAGIRRGLQGAGAEDLVNRERSFWERAGAVVGDSFLNSVIPGGRALSRRLFGDALEDAEVLRDYGERLIERTQELEDSVREAMSDDLSLAFGQVIRNSEDLEAGLQRLSVQGATAAEEFDAIVESLSGLGEGLDVGEIAPGMGLQFIEDISLGSADRIREALESLQEQDITALAEELRRGVDARRIEPGDFGDLLQDLVDIDADAIEEALAGLDEEQIVELYDQINQLVNERVRELGLTEGGVLPPEEAQRLADDVAAMWGDGLDITDEALRDFLSQAVRSHIDQATGVEPFLLEPEAFAEVRDVLLQRIPASERRAELQGRDSVAAANVRLEKALELQALEMANNNETSFASEQARLEAERNLADALSERATIFNQLAQAQLAESDVAGRTSLEVADAVRLYQQAIERGDVDEATRKRSELIELRRRQAQEERDRVGAERLVLDPRDAVSLADAELQNAREALDAVEKFDSAGNVTRAYSEAQRDVLRAEQSHREAQTDLANSVDRAGADPRDEVRQAELELLAAQRALGDALVGTQGYYDAMRGVIAAQQALARINVERAGAFRMAQIDPRDTVRRTQAELRNARDMLGTMLPTSREYAEQQDRINQLELDEARNRAERANAVRSAAVDPRDALGRARADLENAVRDQNLELRGTAEWHQARQRVTEARLEIANQERALSAARRAAGVFPGSRVQAAQAAVGDAADELRAALRNTPEYYQALRAYQNAQIDLGEAVAEYQSVRRMLSIDITDPVATAREELRAARERLARLAAAGAPEDVLAPARLEERQRENALEMAAFQQRFQDAQTANELGRISHQAYIRYLEDESARLGAIADRTRQQQDMLDQVDKALKAATEQMEGQFNLGDIRVPTPYEVRRAIEARAQGIGYSDAAQAMAVTNVNNQVTINGADLVQVKQFLMQVLGPEALQRSTPVAARKV